MTDTKGIEVIGTDTGPCPLCLKSRDKPLFLIVTPGYPPKCCGDHLRVLAEQLKTEAQ